MSNKHTGSCERQIDQHDTSMGQRKNLIPQQEVLIAQWIERPPSVQVMGSIPVRDSDFFSCHVDQFTFHIFITELKIHHLYSLIPVVVL